ncbi:hypothetical protein F511_33453 [Dorcoceras hygrometricum]|uniref:Uncharacterized protein n=1 Tax=Dorcoceras hygrometricum TaxID=472368 RepID=A0A2Z7BJ56_9LAMI|nr:hypothetical protein F511_33453 [Dorcoceras hygrometricum]
MASTFIANSYQVNFDFVLLISDHDGMLNMFKELETSVLRGFLGCESVVYEKELEQFFDTALVQDGDITGAISGKFMKHEYRFLNDILAKAITVKARSFDAVTNERFMMMTAIHFGLKVNWSKVLFSVLKDMVDRTQKKAKGYAAQIGVLLKIIPAITMGEGVPFPISKILSIKTVNTYVEMNHMIDARSQSDEPGVADVAVVKRKSKSKKKSETTDDTQVEIISVVAGSKKRPAAEDSALVIPKNRRTVKGKASLDVVPVAQDVVPLQIIEPISAATVVKSPAPKRISRKRRLVLPTGSDDEIMDTQEPVKDTDEIAEKHTDEIDDIIDIGDDFDQWLEESFKDFVVNETGTVVEAESSKVPVVEKDMDKAVGSKHTEEEHMNIDDLLLQISDDMMLPKGTGTMLASLGSPLTINTAFEKRDADPSLQFPTLQDDSASNSGGGGARNLHKCVKIFSSSSNNLVGFVLSVINPPSFNTGSVEENCIGIWIFVARLVYRGIHWVCSVRLDKYSERHPLGEWMDFIFSLGYLICLSEFGLLSFYGATNGVFVASLDLVTICRFDCRLSFQKPKNNCDVPNEGHDDSDTKLISLSGKRKFRRLLRFPHSTMLGVMDESGITFMFYTDKLVQVNHSLVEKVIPHQDYSNTELLIGWEVAAAEIGYQRVFDDIAAHQDKNLLPCQSRSSYSGHLRSKMLLKS